MRNNASHFKSNKVLSPGITVIINDLKQLLNNYYCKYYLTLFAISRANCVATTLFFLYQLIKRLAGQPYTKNLDTAVCLIFL